MAASDAQDLYVAQQRRSLERVTGALAVTANGPDAMTRSDLEAFRQTVLAHQADLMLEEQLAAQLSRSDKSTIADVFE
jgi:hypothetical protein